MYYPLLETAALKLNFSLQLTLIKSEKSLVENIFIVSNRIRDGTMDITSFPAQPQNIANTSNLDVGIGLRPFVAVVPVMKISKLNIPSDIFIYTFLIPIALLIIVHGARLLKIQTEYWNILDILQMLLGQSIKMNPRKLFEKFLFLNIFWISMMYSSEFYSKIMDIRIVQKEIAFDTIEEMIDCPFKVYANKDFYKRIFDTDQQELLALKKKSEPIEEASLCAEMNLGGKPSICILLEDFAKRHAMRNRTLMKVAEPIFLYDQLVYTTKLSFPFTEEFEKIFHDIHSSGILMYIKNAQRMGIGHMEEYGNDNRDFDNISNQIIFILLGGYIISTIVFLTELLWNHSKIYCHNLGRNCMLKKCKPWFILKSNIIISIGLKFILNISYSLISILGLSR